MAFTVDGLMRLWDNPPADLEAAFREVYADPVLVNRERRGLPELVGMANGMRTVFGGTAAGAVDVVETPGHVAVAFRLRGRVPTAPRAAACPASRERAAGRGGSSAHSATLRWSR